MYSVLDNLTPFMLGALKRARHVSQLVRKSVSRQIVKNILSWIRNCHPSGESCKQEACWEWAPPPWVSTYRHLHAHRFNRYSEVTPFINLPSRNCFRRIDDKCEIGTIIRVLYNFSKAAVIAVTYPIRAGKFSNSHVPIPDWIDCGVGRFTPIDISFEAIRSSQRGPHQSEWRKTSLPSTALCTCFVAPLIKTCW
jgi:hypothetical protein